MHLHKEIIIEGGTDGITNRLTGVVITYPTRLNAMGNNNTTTATLSPITDRMTPRVTVIKADSEEDLHAGHAAIPRGASR